MRLALALVLLVAGCLSPDAPPPPPAPTEISVELAGCTIPEAFASVDAALVRPHVPDDFALRTDGSGRALVILGGLVCEGAARGILAVAVTPLDDALLGEGVENYFWEPEHQLVAGHPLTDAFLAVGANATMAASVEAAVSATGASLRIDAGSWQHAVTAVPGAPTGGDVAFLFGHFREYAAGDGGYVYLDAAFEGGSAATAAPALADVRTGEGTLAREWLGQASTWPLLGGAGLTYADAFVGSVAR